MSILLPLYSGHLEFPLPWETMKKKTRKWPCAFGAFGVLDGLVCPLLPDIPLWLFCLPPSFLLIHLRTKKHLCCTLKSCFKIFGGGQVGHGHWPPINLSVIQKWRRSLQFRHTELMIDNQQKGGHNNAQSLHLS
jgi:hypothetical protein